MKEHRAFDQNYGDATAGGAALHPTTTATSIRKDASGAFNVTDAPLRRPRVCAPDRHLQDRGVIRSGEGVDGSEVGGQINPTRGHQALFGIYQTRVDKG
jgi:hypothetical protein